MITWISCEPHARWPSLTTIATLGLPLAGGATLEGTWGGRKGRPSVPELHTHALKCSSCLRPHCCFTKLGKAVGLWGNPLASVWLLEKQKSHWVILGAAASLTGVRESGVFLWNGRQGPAFVRFPGDSIRGVKANHHTVTSCSVRLLWEPPRVTTLMSVWVKLNSRVWCEAGTGLDVFISLLLGSCGAYRSAEIRGKGNGVEGAVFSLYLWLINILLYKSYPGHFLKRLKVVY